MSSTKTKRARRKPRPEVTDEDRVADLAIHLAIAVEPGKLGYDDMVSEVYARAVEHMKFNAQLKVANRDGRLCLPNPIHIH